MKRSESRQIEFIALLIVYFVFCAIFWIGFGISDSGLEEFARQHVCAYAAFVVGWFIIGGVSSEGSCEKFMKREVKKELNEYGRVLSSGTHALIVFRIVMVVFWPIVELTGFCRDWWLTTKKRSID